MSILQNPWFVGISTGIISGILVFFGIKWIMDKRGKTEYFKQANSANCSVINALKPYIADKGLPDINVFKALVASNAWTFNINKKDMYSVEMYCEELIREIISDVYVSNDKKQEYTSLIAEYISNIIIERKIDDSADSDSVRMNRERSNIQRISMMAAFLVAPVVTSITILMLFVNDEDSLIRPCLKKDRDWIKTTK